MYNLHGFLNLQRSNNRGTDRCCGHTTFCRLGTHDICTTCTKHDVIELVTRQTTLIAVHSRHIYLHSSRQIFNTTINPTLPCTHTQTIQLVTGDAAVKTTYHYINRAIQTETHIREEISDYRYHFNLRIYFAGTLGNNLRFISMVVCILFTEQNRAGKIRQLNLVEINHIDMADAKERQILNHLITKCSTTGNKYAGILYPVFFEPRE